MTKHYAKLKQKSIQYFISDKLILFSIVILILLTFAIPTIYVIFSYVQRDIFNGLENKNRSEFDTAIKYYILIILIIIPIEVVKNFMTSTICNNWRKYITKITLDQYYSYRVYYNLERNGSVDNPDERICDDIKNFTLLILKYVLLLCDTVLNFILFSLVLIKLSPFLYGFVLVYSITGTLLTHCIGKPLYSMYFDQLKKEANLRVSLIQTRENSETIAFYNYKHQVSEVELKTVEDLFYLVYQIQGQIISKQLHLEFFTKRSVCSVYYQRKNE